jgi:hypothetical protein
MFAGRFSFRGLQGVHFFNRFLRLFLDHMSRQVAVPASPLGIRVGASNAEFSGGKDLYSVTTFAPLNNGIALSTIITAPLLGHEGAIHANFDYLANHFTYLLKK